MENYYVNCITTGTYLGTFHSEESAKNAIRRHCLDEDHRFSIRKEISLSKIMTQRDEVGSVEQIKYRILCPTKNYKSNWYTNKPEVLSRLYECQKRFKDAETYIVENKKQAYKSIRI